MNYDAGQEGRLPKHAQVAVIVRARIKDGTLLPGASAPSGAELARETGFAALTCRKALQELIADGALVPGPSRNARPRVPAPATTQRLTQAERALSTELAARRQEAKATQRELADAVGVSVTTVGHAETGRVWQSRRFWERADQALNAGGALLSLHDDYRAAQEADAEAGDSPRRKLGPRPLLGHSAGTVTCVTITWGDGRTTTVYPPVGVGISGASPRPDASGRAGAM